jgi:hypothetical protein
MCLLLLQLRSKMGILNFHVLHHLKWNTLLWGSRSSDLAGLGGIDDVEDMLDDEGFLQLLRQQEVSIPPTFVILEIGQR